MNGIFFSYSLPQQCIEVEKGGQSSFTQARIEQLMLKDLTLRLVFLLLILSGTRGQTVHLFRLDHMTLSDTKCEFIIARKVKQTRVGCHTPPVCYEAYPSDLNLCVINHLREYVARTQSLRKPDCQNC